MLTRKSKKSESYKVKLRDKREVDSLKQKERKNEIDEGLKLVNQIEKLRILRIEEEKNLIEFRERSIKEIQNQIASFILDKETLSGELISLQETRKSLIVPLDTEWRELDKIKIQLIEDKQELYLQSEQLKIEKKKDAQIKKSILFSITKARKMESDAQKLFHESTLFKENAENEYLLAKHEHIIQNDEYGKRLADIELLKETYQNGININSMDENKLRDWENELIIREQDLERRSNMLQIVERVQNGNS